MGNGPSREEQLYQAVTQSNHQAVKTLRRDGASLEWVDKERRTPLILACTRGDLYDMVITLLNDGAKLDAYRPGTNGGFPLHHAAKRGLDKTVLLLLSRGADPLAINDDGLTPLDMARQRNHVLVVRIIEDRICLFSGMMRELSRPGLLETYAPHLFTKKVWVVVLPTESDMRRPSRNELAIYQSPEVAIPRTVISLAKAEVEEPKFSLPEPQLIITATDKNAKVKFKFLSEIEGDKAQLERLYKACAKGIRQTGSASSTQPGLPSQVALQGVQALMRPTGAQPSAPDNQLPIAAPPPVRQPPPPRPPPPTVAIAPLALGPPPPPPTGKGKLSTSTPPSKIIPQSPEEDTMSEDIALATAIDASTLTASAEGITLTHARQGNYSQYLLEMSREFNGWGEEVEQSSDSGWAPSSNAGAGPSRLRNSSETSTSTSDSRTGSTSTHTAVAERIALAQVNCFNELRRVFNGRGDGFEQSSFSRLLDEVERSYCSGWPHSSSVGAGPSRLRNSSETSTSTSDSRTGSTKQTSSRPATSPVESTDGLALPSPSALPLLPAAPPLQGPISYPFVDTTPVGIDYTNSIALVEVPPNEKKTEEKITGGQCVVCWDAPAKGVCIPCGHLAGCMSCLTKIKSKDWGCPVCRATIQQVIKVYAV